MFHFTLDADGTHIKSGADIHAVDTYDDALTAVQDHYASSGFEVAGLTPGHFGDCWVRANDLTALHNLKEQLTEEVGELVIMNPGSHPGGNCYWILPRATINVPVLTALENIEDEAEDEDNESEFEGG